MSLTEDIHFLHDELQEHLDHQLETLLYHLRHPDADKNLAVLHELVKTLIAARAHQLHPPQTSTTTPPEAPPPTLEQPAPVQIPQPTPLPKPHLADYARNILTTPLSLAQKKKQTTQRTQQPPPPTPAAYYHTSVFNLEHPQQTDEPATTFTLITDSETHDTLATATIKNGTYTIHEPPLTTDDVNLLTKAKTTLTDTTATLTSRRKLLKHLTTLAKQLRIELLDQHYPKYRYYLIRDLLAYGPVEPLTHDTHITRIICDGPVEPVTLIRNSQKLTTTLTLAPDAINAILHAVARTTYQKLTTDEPLLDATSRGFRIQAVLGTDLVPSRFIMTRITA